ncbi:MAG: hypothetical protein WC627_02730 [Legionella sp.]|jgi:hypothetical protein
MIVVKSFKEEQNLIPLLKASQTKEVILYNNAKCLITFEPAFSNAELEIMEKKSPEFFVHSSRKSNNHIQSTIGFFHSRTYNYFFVNESYRMSITDLETEKNVTMVIKSINLENPANLSNPEWLQDNVDSVTESTCTIL